MGRYEIVWVIDGFVVEGREGLEGVPWMGSKAELVGEVCGEGVIKGLLDVACDEGAVVVEAKGEVKQGGSIERDVRERGVDVSVAVGLCGWSSVGVVACGTAANVIRPVVCVTHCKRWEWF